MLLSNNHQQAERTAKALTQISEQNNFLIIHKVKIILKNYRKT